MKYLLDTHTLLWFLAGDETLSRKARQLIDDPGNEEVSQHRYPMGDSN